MAQNNQHRRRHAAGTQIKPDLTDRPEPQATVEQEDEACSHNWERDGQTLTSVRWTCTKCGKTMLC